MFVDFLRYWQCGALLLRGDYNGLYSLPLTAVFSLFALLPSNIACGIFITLSFVVFYLVRQARIDTAAWMLFMPITLSLVFGRLDLLLISLILQGSPLALVLSSLMPQWFVFAIPGLWKQRRRWKEMILMAVALYGIPSVIRPTWILEWFHRGTFFDLSTSLWAWEPHLGTVIIVVIALLFFASRWTKVNWPAALNILLPINGGSFLVLFNRSSVWLLAIVSWITFALMSTTHSLWPMPLISLVAFGASLQSFAPEVQKAR